MIEATGSPCIHAVGAGNFQALVLDNAHADSGYKEPFFTFVCVGGIHAIKRL